MKTYLFYDIETTGLNPAFDQILTFACIQTDLALHEIDRQMITIRLRKDIVPSPKAFLTHGLTRDELALGITEYEAALKIHTLLNRPGTVSLGYNSLGFDDEFLRFLFYRNLLDPYRHQYNDGCSRMDVLPITAIFKVFHPTVLSWPQVEGKPSLRLDLITRENNFETSGRAHEAMSDVEALIQLSKIFYQQKKIWEYCLDFFNKTRDEIRINNLEKSFDIQNKRFRLCLMVSTSFGSKVNYMAPVIHLGQSTAYKNQSLWLRLDSDNILGLDSDMDVGDTFVIRKRSADALIVLPALERFWSKLPVSSRQSARDNMEKLRHHQENFFEFILYHREYKYPFIPDVDQDAGLYQEGFFSSLEKKQSDLFHKTVSMTGFDTLKSDHGKSEILDKLTSPRIKKMAHRILARNFVEQEVAQTGEIESLLSLNRLRSSLEKDRIIGYKNDYKFNCRQGLQELKDIGQTFLNPDQEQRKMLDWLKEYFETL